MALPFFSLVLVRPMPTGGFSLGNTELSVNDGTDDDALGLVRPMNDERLGNDGAPVGAGNFSFNCVRSDFLRLGGLIGVSHSGRYRIRSIGAAVGLGSATYDGVSARYGVSSGGGGDGSRPLCGGWGLWCCCSIFMAFGAEPSQSAPARVQACYCASK